MLVLNTNRISYIGIPTPQSHLPLCDLERSKLRCWKWSKIDTCMVGYSVRVNPRFQLFESAAVRLSYKSAENWHSSYQLQLSSMTPRSMDILFVCCCCLFVFFIFSLTWDHMGGKCSNDISSETTQQIFFQKFTYTLGKRRHRRASKNCEIPDLEFLVFCFYFERFNMVINADL